MTDWCRCGLPPSDTACFVAPPSRRDRIPALQHELEATFVELDIAAMEWLEARAKGVTRRGADDRTDDLIRTSRRLERKIRQAAK